MRTKGVRGAMGYGTKNRRAKVGQGLVQCRPIRVKREAAERQIKAKGGVIVRVMGES